MTFPTDIDGNITYNDKKYGKLDEYTDLLGSKTDIGIKLKGQKILTDKLSNAHETLKEQRLNIGKIIDIKQTDRLLASGSGEFYQPYTILCSQKYLKNLLSKVEPGYMCRLIEQVVRMKKKRIAVIILWTYTQNLTQDIWQQTMLLRGNAAGTDCSL